MGGSLSTLQELESGACGDWTRTALFSLSNTLFLSLFLPRSRPICHLPGASCQSVVLYSTSIDVRNLSLLDLQRVVGFGDGACCLGAAKPSQAEVLSCPRPRWRSYHITTTTQASRGIGIISISSGFLPLLLSKNNPWAGNSSVCIYPSDTVPLLFRHGGPPASLLSVLPDSSSSSPSLRFPSFLIRTREVSRPNKY